MTIAEFPEVTGTLKKQDSSMQQKEWVVLQKWNLEFRETKSFVIDCKKWLVITLERYIIFLTSDSKEICSLLLR